MSQFKNYEIAEWTLPTDVGVSRKDDPLFEETSPSQPVTYLQFWVDWKNMAGGGPSSTLDIEVFIYGSYFRTNAENKAWIAQVGAAAATTVQTYQLASTAAPADGSDYIRIGNQHNEDGRFMRIFGERYRVVILNGGTAYTGGKVTVAPVGWIQE